MADIYKVAQSWMSIWVHKGPGVSYARVDVIYGKDNKEYTILERQNKYWLKIGDNRWVCDRDANGTMVMNKTGTSSESVKQEEEKEMEQIDEESYAYIPEFDPIGPDDEFENKLNQGITLKDLRGILGMPYQFMTNVDMRLPTENDSDYTSLIDNASSIGRKYAKEIVSNLPILLMTAGKPVFMGGYSTADKKNILKNYVNIATDSEISNLVFSDDFGKYYSLEYAYNEYFEYVNSMCRYAARMLNVHDAVVDGQKLESRNWASNINENFQRLFSVYRGAVAIYCDSETSISDSFSNGTTTPAIADKINGASDTGRELQFLLGTVKTQTGIAFDKFTDQEELTKNMENMNSFLSSVLGSNGLSSRISSLANSIQTVASGGKIVFPEIWSDSSFSRSYDIKLKLVSPDGDNLSIYLNIIVPIIHLMAFTLPREAKSHAYISPFLVRAFYKGLFNVDMGIITDLSISKGREGAWTPSGIPTMVDISFSIKDLYNELYISNSDKGTNMMNNIMLMDYIGNMCGVNINDVDIYRAIDLWYIQNVKNKITDLFHMKIFGNIDQYISNSALRIFGKF